MAAAVLALVPALLAAAAPAAPRLVRYAPVTVERAPPPARFAAPLPRVQDFPDGLARRLGWPDDPRWPPVAHARDLLCAGDAGTWRRAEAALEASVRAGATSGDVLATYGELVRPCRRETCWAVALARRGTLPAALPAWLVAARCDDADARALFQRADVPAPAVLARDWAARFEGVRARPPAAQVGAAALELIRSGPVEERPTALSAAVDSGDPRTIEVLVEQARATADERWRVDLLEALRGNEDPRARALLAPCLRSREAAFACGLTWVEDAEPPPRFAEEDLAGRLRHGNVDDVIDHTPAARSATLVSALEACAREDDRGDFYARWSRVRCLRGLARVDRPRAVAVAPALARLPDPDARELVVALTRYPAPGALARRLAALGLLPAGAADGGLSAREVLVAAGACAELDVETGQYPNEHDALLRTLWALGRERLPVVFEEVAPARRGAAPYALRAYAAGARLETAAADLGDWYDLGASVGLLNALERHLGRDRRFVLLLTLDQSTAVVAGPEAGLRAAVAEGLLVVGSALGPVDVGNAAEDVVRERLERGEP